jgi:hypothetical protein
MNVTIKVGSVITLPWGDVADVTSSSPILKIEAAPTGGIIITGVHVGDAVVTLRWGVIGSVSTAVKVV